MWWDPPICVIDEQQLQTDCNVGLAGIECSGRAVHDFGMEHLLTGTGTTDVEEPIYGFLESKSYESTFTLLSRY